MSVIEPAASGRAKCRACGRTIAKGELRFGEQGPNPFGEGEATFWFHLRCAAFKRPESAAPTLRTSPDVADRDQLLAFAERGLAHPHLARIAAVQRSPSGRARCRHCREPIAKDGWRIALEDWEDGRFGGSGYVHVACAAAYFGTIVDLEPRIAWFSPEVGQTERAQIMAAAAAAA